MRHGEFDRRSWMFVGPPGEGNKEHKLDSGEHQQELVTLQKEKPAVVSPLVSSLSWQIHELRGKKVARGNRLSKTTGNL